MLGECDVPVFFLDGSTDTGALAAQFMDIVFSLAAPLGMPSLLPPPPPQLVVKKEETGRPLGGLHPRMVAPTHTSCLSLLPRLCTLQARPATRDTKASASQEAMKASTQGELQKGVGIRRTRHSGAVLVQDTACEGGVGTRRHKSVASPQGDTHLEGGVVQTLSGPAVGRCTGHTTVTTPTPRTCPPPPLPSPPTQGRQTPDAAPRAGEPTLQAGAAAAKPRSQLPGSSPACEDASHAAGSRSVVLVDSNGGCFIPARSPFSSCFGSDRPQGVGADNRVRFDVPRPSHEVAGPGSSQAVLCDASQSAQPGAAAQLRGSKLEVGDSARSPTAAQFLPGESQR